MIDNAIGGYFELELTDRGFFPHQNGVLLNSGRNALEYILRSLPDVKRIWLPYYTCDVVLEPLEKLQITHSFYHIDQQLHLVDDVKLNTGDYLLYTDYYGLMGKYVRELALRYGKNLIVDYAQAWFAEPVDGLCALYSPRKFFGVPDGGIAYCPNGFEISQFELDKSYNRSSHLLKRIDLGPTEGYGDFNENRKTFHNQPICRMSNLTRTLLRSIDYEMVRSKRRDNYRMLSTNLQDSNLLRFQFDDDVVPMVYPYLPQINGLSEKLIAKRIFVARYWPNVFEWCQPTDWEYQLTENLVCIPIDQRYGKDEMDFIIDTILHD